MKPNAAFAAVIALLVASGVGVSLAGQAQDASCSFAQQAHAGDYYRAAVAYASMGRYSDAVICLRKRLRQRFDSVDAHATVLGELAVAYAKDGRKDQARRTFKEALSMDVSDSGKAALLRSKGLFHMSLGQVHEAAAALQNSVQLSKAAGNSARAHESYDASLYYQLGMARELQGRFREALELYKTAAAMSHVVQPVVHLGLARMYNRLGKRRNAAKHADAVATSVEMARRAGAHGETMYMPYGGLEKALAAAYLGEPGAAAELLDDLSIAFKSQTMVDAATLAVHRAAYNVSSWEADAATESRLLRDLAQRAAHMNSLAVSSQSNAPIAAQTAHALDTIAMSRNFYFDVHDLPRMSARFAAQAYSILESFSRVLHQSMAPLTSASGEQTCLKAGAQSVGLRVGVLGTRLCTSAVAAPFLYASLDPGSSGTTTFVALERSRLCDKDSRLRNLVKENAALFLADKSMEEQREAIQNLQLDVLLDTDGLSPDNNMALLSSRLAPIQASLASCMGLQLPSVPFSIGLGDVTSEPDSEHMSEARLVWPAPVPWAHLSVQELDNVVAEAFDEAASGPTDVGKEATIEPQASARQVRICSVSSLPDISIHAVSELTAAVESLRDVDVDVKLIFPFQASVDMSALPEKWQGRICQSKSLKSPQDYVTACDLAIDIGAVQRPWFAAALLSQGLPVMATYGGTRCSSASAHVVRDALPDPMAKILLTTTKRLAASLKSVLADGQQNLAIATATLAALGRQAKDSPGGNGPSLSSFLHMAITSLQEAVAATSLDRKSTAIDIRIRKATRPEWLEPTAASDRPYESPQSTYKKQKIASPKSRSTPEQEQVAMAYFTWMATVLAAIGDSAVQAAGQVLREGLQLVQQGLRYSSTAAEETETAYGNADDVAGMLQTVWNQFQAAEEPVYEQRWEEQHVDALFREGDESYVEDEEEEDDDDGLFVIKPVSFH